MGAWIEQELCTAALGDKRLNDRFVVVMGQLSDQPTLSITAACGERKEAVAAYRFFDNDKVDDVKVLQPHQDSTRERCRAHPVVLAVQDTTELDLTRKQEKVGGPLNNDRRWGLFVHPVLMVTPARLPLGVLDAEIWGRDPKAFAQSAAKKKRQRKWKPIEQKESYRWVEGYRAADALAKACPETRVISVADSEADIYEVYVTAMPTAEPQADFVVRCCHADRGLEQSQENLRQLLLCRQPIGTMTITVSERKTAPDSRKRQKPRSARTLEATIRATRTLFKPPVRKGQQLPPVWVNAVLVLEENPPAGEEPIEWLLLTSLPIATVEEVHAVIAYYCVRWEIEVFFRVLKSGCQIEKLQLETTERFRVCLAIYLIVAWRIMYLTMLSRTQPQLPCDEVLEEAEWKAVYTIALKKPAPLTPPTLEELVELIAKLGGYQGRKQDGPPGPKAMWIGLQRMRDYAIAYESFGPGRPSP